MPLEEYKAGQAVDPASLTDKSVLKGKSVVVTGGASGLGLAYVKVFASAGAFVTFGDLNVSASEKIASDLGQNVQFVKCDVTSWPDQVSLFKAAVSESPARSCDIVVANAGIARNDDVFAFDEDSEEPTEPDLSIMKVNAIGPLYTAKLAMHYFNRQPEDSSRDRCLIVKGSLAAYLDLPGSPQYNMSKAAMRSFVNCIRRTGWQKSIRVNLIAPWFIATPILSKEAITHISGSGIEFATEDDAAAAVLKVACDKSINGRALGVVPRSEAEYGYLDLKHDDYAEDDYMRTWQDRVLSTSHRIQTPSKQDVGPEGFGSK
jgi:NAD(P)-dependent dehydrogenase (short-subunit alcohol dehydrogenase family)